MRLEIRPVEGIGDITAGDDLASIILAAAPWIADGDVLVVTSKIVSKAEGRLVEVPADGPPREQARRRALESETARVVARRGPTTIVQTHHGFVMAAAGIDASNVDKTHLVLLPADPDASARALRADLRAHGRDVAVIISDTMGRAWRNGLTDAALGAAGIEPIRDHRGEIDPYGNELELTQMAVADELAAAAELVKGKCDQVPVAVVRGYHHAGEGDGPGAAALVRDAASDMFSLGTAEARADGLKEAARLPEAVANAAHSADAVAGAAHLPDAAVGAARLPDAAVGAARLPDADAVAGADPAAVQRALATVDGLLTAAVEARPGALRLTPDGAGPAALIRLGADGHRLRAALAAEGVPTTAVFEDDAVTLTFGAAA